MGRRRRDQDTTNVVIANPAAEVQNAQLEVQPIPVEAVVEQTETKPIAKPVEEIPYDDRPIPEAYFPPEDLETAQEFIPEPHIQKTVLQTSSYKRVSIKELDALKFISKSTEIQKTEEKSVDVAKTTTVKSNCTNVSNKEIESLFFAVKPVEKAKIESKDTEVAATTIAKAEEETKQIADTQVKESEVKAQTENAHAKESRVASNNIDFTSLKFDKYIKTTKTDSSKSINNIIIAEQTKSDGLTAINSAVSKDSLSLDSLAKDSAAYIPVENPELKREIVSIDGKELPETVNTMWWYTPILLALFIAYVIVVRDRKKAIFSEIQSFIKPTTDGSIFGFQWLQNSKYKFVLSTLGVITGSLYLFLAKDSMLSASWIFFLAVTVFVVGKKLLLSLLEYIYFEGADKESMSSAFMVLVRQTGLFLIPSVLGLSFAPEEYRHIFTYLGIFVIGLAVFAFNFKLFVNFLRGITSIFYLILYLCTLEVIPIAIFFVLGLLPRV